MEAHGYDLRERVVRLEERLTAMSTAVSEVRKDVVRVRSDLGEMREQRAASRALAKEASRRTAVWFAGGGLVLTAVNVTAMLWIGVH